MIRLHVEGIGLCGPGLAGWAGSVPVLAGQAAYEPALVVIPPADLLPPNERRRAPRIVKLALAVGTEAFAAAGRAPVETASIFASSGGDGETIHEILDTLASPRRELSPTRFHNSVHNVAAGYWNIATGAKAPATSLCAYDGSFAAGLLEAGAQAAALGKTVALIAYDIPYPAPLAAARPISAIFGVALLLSPVRSPASRACIELALAPQPGMPTPAGGPALEALRRNVPAARCLPLLEALAGNRAAEIRLDYLEDLAVAIRVTPA